MGDHLRETGRQLVLDPERTKDPVEFVERLLTEKEKYDKCGLPSGPTDLLPLYPAIATLLLLLALVGH